MWPARLPGKLTLLLAVSALAATAAAQPAMRPLGAGAVVRASLSPGSTHAYAVELAAGELLELVVDQRGVDVVTTVVGPDGTPLLEADRMIGPRGPEPLAVVASEPGAHRVEIRTAGGYGDGTADAPGEYELTVTAVRPASEDDLLRARAVRLVYEASSGPGAGPDPDRARTALVEAAELWRRLGDAGWEGEAAERTCVLERSQRDWSAAAAACARAAERFAAAGDPRRRGMALRTLGATLLAKGDTAEAIAAYDEALTLASAVDDPSTLRTVLYGRGQTHQVRDEVQRALDDYAAALEHARDQADRSLEASTLHDLGVLYRVLGRPGPARNRLEQAEELFAELGLDSRRARSMNQLGNLAREAGDLSEAMTLYRRALTLRETAGDTPGAGVTLAKIAGIHRARGELHEALDTYRRALALIDSQQEPWLRANALVAIGALHEDAGRLGDARASFAEAAAAYRAIGDPTGEAEGLLGLARNHPPGGDEEAVRAALTALDLLETVRASALRDDLRTSFFASVQGHYDLAIDLMMDLDRARPAEGWSGRALGVAERARARALLDRLGENAAAFQRGVDPALLADERRLREELSAAEARRLLLLDLQVRADQVKTVERIAGALAEELEAARARIRAASPRYREATEPRILAGDEIGGLLDPDTLLLAYHLGEAGGALWLVSPDGVEAFPLPPRERIEADARRAHRLLGASHAPVARASLAAVLCRLGDRLLGPVADRLGTARLVIVPDGALHYLPFAALPAPRGDTGCAGASPLVANHEVVHLPSASALAAVRRELDGRPPPDGVVAVLADPVFDRSDPRVPSDAPPPPPGTTSNDRGYPRLPYTREEADAILRLAPEAGRFGAFGFDADRQAVLDGRMSDFRWVHLATHGVLDEEDPSLSGLVLSQLDRQGRPRNGFLQAHELYDLELAADMVVLSGCGTALGAEVRGEGLVGLARAFMTAGAGSLMVSLWRVSDRATAHLMEDLYRRILDGGSRPATALREAQLAAWRRGAPPAEWAAFVLQGDWRTGPAPPGDGPTSPPARARAVTTIPTGPPTSSERSTP